jgi:hypothetical protein
MKFIIALASAAVLIGSASAQNLPPPSRRRGFRSRRLAVKASRRPVSSRQQIRELPPVRRRSPLQGRALLTMRKAGEFPVCRTRIGSRLVPLESSANPNNRSLISVMLPGPSFMGPGRNAYVLLRPAGAGA